MGGVFVSVLTMIVLQVGHEVDFTMIASALYNLLLPPFLFTYRMN
jgi:hypothetical protein